MLTIPHIIHSSRVCVYVTSNKSHPTSFPFRYFNYVHNNDWVRGSLVLRTWMKDPTLKLQATVKFIYSIGPTDRIGLSVMDWTLGMRYFSFYTGQSLV
jgi:hypothetical protein